MNYSKNNILFILVYSFIILVSCSKEPTTTNNNCADGIHNGLEEDIDCGGDCPKQCISCSDGIQNGFEEGIDCGTSCEILCPCKRENLCMQAFVQGLTWEALEVQIVYNDLGLNIIGSNFDFIKRDDADGRRRALITLLFPNPAEQDLPYSIEITDEDSDLVSYAEIIDVLIDEHLRSYEKIRGATITLTAFDADNQTATGEFAISAKTISELAPFSEVQAQIWDGRFSVNWE